MMVALKLMIVSSRVGSPSHRQTMTLLRLCCLCVVVLAWTASCYVLPMDEHSETTFKCGEGRCDCNATHADCQHMELLYIPTLPPGITSLDFSGNVPLITGRADFFDNAKSIVWLDLSFSFFSDSTDIYLPFYWNKHRKLNFTSSTFERLTHLTYLDVSGCYLPCSSLSAVFQIPSLQVLKLKSVEGCEGLESLNITRPALGLQELDLTNIKTYSYPNLSCLSPFTGLKRLIIRSSVNGRGTVEPSPFSYLGTLNVTYIDMSAAFLSCKELAIVLDTPSLQEVKLADGGTACEKFDFILKDRGTNITTLDLSGNKISRISYGSLPANLNYLDLSYNRLESMKTEPGVMKIEYSDGRAYILKGFRLVCHDKLQYLDLSGNKLNDKSINYLKPSCLPNLTRLILHGNRFGTRFSLEKVLVRFSCFHNLEMLDLSGQRHTVFNHMIDTGVRNVRLKWLNLADNYIDLNDNYSVPTDTFLPYSNMTSLSLAKNNLSAVSEEHFLQLFGHLVHLQHLSLRSAGLRVIPPTMVNTFTALRSLDLSHNALFSLPDDILKPLSQLTMLDVSFNRMIVVPDTMFPDATRYRLQQVDFSENPLICSCEVLWFRSWLLTSPSVFARSSSHYLCANLPDTPITSFSMVQQACLLSKETSKFIIATVSLIFLGLSSLTFVYRYRWHIRLVLHEVFRAPEDRLRRLRQNHFQYDVFVCYDSDDFPWVRDHLMPSLEKGMGLKLCLHHRDFIPGTPIVDNIEDSVVASKKMLMVFSRQFAQSPWCQFELQLCLTHAMDTQDALIVVLLEDIPSRELTSSMMAVMKTTTYMEWADEAEARHCFWRRMGLALHEILPCA